MPRRDGRKSSRRKEEEAERQEEDRSPDRTSQFLSPDDEVTDYEFTFDNGQTNDQDMDLTPPGNGRVSFHRSVSQQLDNTSSPRRETRANASVLALSGRNTSRTSSSRAAPFRAASTSHRPGPSREKPLKKPTNRRKQATPKRKDYLWLKEVRRLQQTTALLIPRLPFARLVREQLQSRSRWPDMRITREALMALQESSEMYLTYFFEDAYRLTRHAKRVTIMAEDMRLIYALRTNWGVNAK